MYVTEEIAYRGLGAAIVLRAMEDYGMALLGQFNDAVKDRAVKEDCERFFKSDELVMYTRVPGETIMKKVQELVDSWPKGKKFCINSTEEEESNEQN